MPQAGAPPRSSPRPPFAPRLPTRHRTRQHGYSPKTCPHCSLPGLFLRAPAGATTPFQGIGTPNCCCTAPITLAIRPSAVRELPEGRCWPPDACASLGQQARRKTPAAYGSPLPHVPQALGLRPRNLGYPQTVRCSRPAKDNLPEAPWSQYFARSSKAKAAAFRAASCWAPSSLSRSMRSEIPRITKTETLG